LTYNYSSDSEFFEDSRTYKYFTQVLIDDVHARLVIVHVPPSSIVTKAEADQEKIMTEHENAIAKAVVDPPLVLPTSIDTFQAKIVAALS